MVKLKLVFHPQILNRPVRKDIAAFFMEAAKRGYSVEAIPLRLDSEKILFSGLRETRGIIVAGGDGTLNLAVNMLLGRELEYPPVGVLPLGTSNDFAHQLITKNLSINGLLNSIDECWTANVDVGCINERYFINVIAAGLFVDVSYKTGSALKKRLGRTAYYLAGAASISNYEPFPLRIRFSDQSEETAEVYLFMVLNSKGVGGFRNLVGQASFDSGCLDLVLIKNSAGLLPLVSLLPRLSKGLSTNNPGVKHYQDISFVLDSPAQISTSADGEQGPSFPLNIKILPGKLDFFVALKPLPTRD